MSTIISLITDRALISDATEISWAGIPSQSSVSKTNQNNVFIAPGVAVTVQYQTLNAVGHIREGVERRDQDPPAPAEGLPSTDWRGNFQAGDALLWTRQQSTNDPIRLVFTPDTGRTVTAAGVQIQPADPGPFTARIAAFDTAGKLIQAFLHNGVSADHFDPADPGNNAPFIGISAPSIGYIEVRPLTLCHGGFCINQLSVAC